MHVQTSIKAILTCQIADIKQDWEDAKNQNGAGGTWAVGAV